MEIVMKKTAFDKIVVGFVILVVLIFSLLMIYSISTTQNTVLAERKSTMQKEIELLMDGPLTDYSNKNHRQQNPVHRASKHSKYSGDGNMAHR